MSVTVTIHEVLNSASIYTDTVIRNSTTVLNMHYKFFMLLFIVCDLLTAPDNGDIDCSLGGDGAANPGDTCTFTCDNGFTLRGSAMRECQFQRSKGTSWSGNEASCEPGMHRMSCEASSNQ